MTDEILLDTNAVIALFKDEKPVLERILRSKKCYVPSIVLGELYFGAYKSAFSEKNLQRIKQLEETSEILIPDRTTANIYGQEKSKLEAKGRLIPDNDLWIVSLALQHHLTVITKDAHFSEIQTLPIERW